MKMVDKIIEAINELEGCSPTCSHCRKIAIGAIRAIREPTEEMIDGGLIPTASWRNIQGSALTVNRAKIKMRYQAMIDAALKE